MTQWPVRRIADRPRRSRSRARAPASPARCPGPAPATATSPASVSGVWRARTVCRRVKRLRAVRGAGAACARLGGMDGDGAEDVAVTGIAAGGEGVGRLADGRAVFVRGALPGEQVRLRVTEERNRFARGEIVEVLAAAAERSAPPCELVTAGCGGCDWQHVAPGAQRVLKG